MLSHAKVKVYLNICVSVSMLLVSQCHIYIHIHQCVLKLVTHIHTRMKTLYFYSILLMLEVLNFPLEFAQRTHPSPPSSLFLYTIWRRAFACFLLFFACAKMQIVLYLFLQIWILRAIASDRKLFCRKEATTTKNTILLNTSRIYSYIGFVQISLKKRNVLTCAQIIMERASSCNWTDSMPSLPLSLSYSPIPHRPTFWRNRKVKHSQWHKHAKQTINSRQSLNLGCFSIQKCVSMCTLLCVCVCLVECVCAPGIFKNVCKRRSKEFNRAKICMECCTPIRGCHLQQCTF